MLFVISKTAWDRNSFLLEQAMKDEYVQVRVNLLLKDLLVHLIHFSQKINYIELCDI